LLQTDVFPTIPTIKPQTVKGLHMKTTEYLDLARARAGLPSDYALAARLGVTRQAVSSWRSPTRPRYPEVLHGYLIAQLCGADPLKVLADIEMDKAEHYEKHDDLAAWQQLLSRVGTAAAAVAMGCVLISPSPSNARQVNNKVADVYIDDSKRDRRRRSAMAAMARTLHSFSGLHLVR
jgi:transcriptional regulator with XRE-family HTH domain